MEQDIQIYVDNREGRGRDTHPGTEEAPLRTADEAFRRLPPSWHKRAEIIFAVTGLEYEIATEAVSFGTAIGPDALPLLIRGDYDDLLTVTAAGGSGNNVITNIEQPVDEFIGAVLTRLSGDGSPVGTAVSIRGNTTGPAAEISLQQSIGPVDAGDTFKIQRPAVTLKPTQALNLTSHDGRSPNLTLVGIKIAPAEGKEVVLLNVRALCDTCEFSLQSKGGLVHTNARIHGGIEIESLAPDPKRAQAGVYIHSTGPTSILGATRNGILGGHLTFKDVTVRVSQGGVLVPHSLEALRASIQILTGGSAMGQPNLGQASWGTENNRARIRNVAGDGLRVFNGGTLNSPVGPIHLDIFGCSGDGIRLDMGSTASFGPPGGVDGLVTSGRKNVGFGMNVRNASRALIGTVPTAPPPIVPRLTGEAGDVTLDSERSPRHSWSEIIIGSPLSNGEMSLVRVNK